MVTPQRTVSGLDLRRLQLLLAVLEKRGGFPLRYAKDVFVNIAGGLKIEDPSYRTGGGMCIYYRLTKTKHCHRNVCLVGEIGLIGRDTRREPYRPAYS